MLALRPLLTILLSFWLLPLRAQTPAPALPPELQAMLDAPLPPVFHANPQGTQFLMLQRSPTLPAAYLAAPWVGLAGVEIATELGASKRRRYLFKASLFDIATRKSIALQVPEDRNINRFEFSPDGKQLALQIDAGQGVELWLVDTAKGRGRKIPSLYVNDIFTKPLTWARDSQSLYVAARTSSASPRVSAEEAATIEEAGGSKVPARTYAHLLRSPRDLALFKAYAEVQWKNIRVADLRQRAIGPAGLYKGLEPAPDGSQLLVERMVAPFSYAVPASLFAHDIEVWKGETRQRVLQMPLADEMPPEGERRGPRDIQWQPDYPARLIWVEALDEGNPRSKVPHRDLLRSWDAPFTGQSTEMVRVVERVYNLSFLPAQNRFLIRSYNPDTSVSSLELYEGAAALKPLLSFDIKDDYNNPGRPVTISDAQGQTRVAQEGDFIFLAGLGKNKEGERPFVDRLNLTTLAKERIFTAEVDARSVEEFLLFYRNTSESMVLARESSTSPPNLWLWTAKTASKEPLTQFADEVPAMTQAEKKPFVFKRKDGLTMSGTLYLPRVGKPGAKLPAVVWAYPQEYRSAAVAGQVRITTQRYSRPAPTGIEWLVTQGYAVLDEASMPLIGDKETVNNTLVEQLVANAQAVVDALDASGYVDRKRIAVGGHSYGAFMTANLLAHSPLFCAGLARSGAYNRSLTPFGFQSERRTFWEAKDFYMKVSPFYHAESIKTPLLLVHGKDDNNSGTTPMQTERMFHALRGVGAKARMVLLPYESHGYRGRENVALVQAETLAWLQRWCSDS